MKVAILGAGAVGSMFGGLLKYHAPDVDVVLIARGSHGQAMRRQGHVALDGPWGIYQVSVPVSDDLENIENSDYVLLCVKSQATEDAICQAAPYLHDTTVISIQNGINQRTLRRHVGAQRLIMGMTATNMAILEPGTVSLQRGGPTIIGSSVDGLASERVAAVASLLAVTGLPVRTSTNIIGVQYNKLAINTIGYASALSASNFITQGLLYRPWRQAVGIPLLRESLAVLKRVGIPMARTPGVSDAHRLYRLLRILQTPVLDMAIRLVVHRRISRRPIIFSLQQDLHRRKKTEIEFVNGEVVRLARECGFEAVYNAKVVELVHELERRADGTFFSPEDVISEFRVLRSNKHAQCARM